MKNTILGILALVAVTSCKTTAQTSTVYDPKDVPKPMEMKPEMTEFWEPAVPVVTPGKTNSDAPSDAIVLFDGKSLSAWKSAKTQGAAEWNVKDGYFEVKPGSGDILTKETFSDVQLHIEWSAPDEVKGTSQGRGNSGVFFHENYEVQVLDNYQNRTYANGQAGSLYKDTPPLVNPIRNPSEWNTYDIIFRSPRFKANGKLDQPATVTVIFNGVVVQNNTTLLGLTQYIGVHQYPEAHGAGSIKLQDHGNTVQFRNIWARKL